MGLRDRILKAAGIHHAVIDEDGKPHCYNCNTDLTGQRADGAQPIRCPSCRAKNFPDLRGSEPMYRKR